MSTFTNNNAQQPAAPHYHSDDDLPVGRGPGKIVGAADLAGTALPSGASMVGVNLTDLPEEYQGSRNLQELVERITANLEALRAQSAHTSQEVRAGANPRWDPNAQVYLGPDGQFKLHGVVHRGTQGAVALFEGTENAVFVLQDHETVLVTYECWIYNHGLRESKFLGTYPFLVRRGEGPETLSLQAPKGSDQLAATPSVLPCLDGGLGGWYIAVYFDEDLGADLSAAGDVQQVHITGRIQRLAKLTPATLAVGQDG